MKYLIFLLILCSCGNGDPMPPQQSESAPLVSRFSGQTLTGTGFTLTFDPSGIFYTQWTSPTCLDIGKWVDLNAGYKSGTLCVYTQASSCGNDGTKFALDYVISNGSVNINDGDISKCN